MFGLGTLGNLVVKVTADTKGFSTKLKGLGKVAKLAGGAIAAAFSVAAVAVLAKGTMALAKRGAEVEGVTKAFEGLTEELEGGSKRWLRALNKGSLGMVNQVDLMKNFNSAAQLIGKDFAQTLPDAMQYFTKISASTGESVDYLMDSYVRGIGRLSPMIIDNLKIQVSQAEATAEAAKMFGVAESELTKYQIQMGMANVVTEKLKESTADLPEVAGTASQYFARFQTTMENLRDKLAVTVLPLFTKIMEGIINALDSPAVQAAIQNFFDWLGRVIGDEGSGLVGILTLLQSGDIEGAIEMAFGQGSYDKLISLRDGFNDIRDAVREIISWVETFIGQAARLQAIYNLIMKLRNPLALGAGIVNYAYSQSGAGAARQVSPTRHETVVYNNYGVDISDSTRVQEALNPFIKEGIRDRGWGR